MRRHEAIPDWAIRMIGLAILALATLAAWRLTEIGAGRSGNEPAGAYALGIFVFWGMSVGTATITLGRQLLRHVVVAEKWLPHVPLAFREDGDVTSAD